MGRGVRFLKHAKFPFECYKTQAVKKIAHDSRHFLLYSILAKSAGWILKGSMTARWENKAQKCLRSLDHLKSNWEKKKLNYAHNEILRQGGDYPAKVTQWKMEAPNNEAVKPAEIKVISLKYKNKFLELSVRIACGQAWETKIHKITF